MESLNLNYESRFQQFLKKIILMNFFFLLIVLFASVLVQNYLYSELARKLITGVHSEVITSDLKTAQRLLVKLSSDIFYRIEFVHLNGDIFLMKDSNDRSIIKNRIKFPVGLTPESPNGYLVFYYSLDNLLSYSFLVFILQLLIIYFYTKIYQKKLIYQINRDRDMAIESNFAQKARQVAHDIRSPYSVLKSYTKNLPGIPADQKKAIELSVTRIGDILYDLEKGRRSGFSSAQDKPSFDSNVSSNVDASSLSSFGAESSPHDSTGPHEKVIVLAALEKIISEKRFQYHENNDFEFNFDFKAPLSSTIMVCPKNFSRVISNLIDNAVQAKKANQPIRVNIEVRLDHPNVLRIFIKDNGVGIPEENLPKLFKLGATFGKESGTGLGLYYAKSQISSWGGDISIHSVSGDGCEVQIQLPIVPAPSWFFSDFNILRGNSILIVDDDVSIHEFWKSRLKDSNLFFATSPSQARSYLSELPDFYILDYDLADTGLNGIDLAREWGVGQNSILVTSYYEDLKIQESCLVLGMKIVPKQILNWI